MDKTKHLEEVFDSLWNEVSDEQREAILHVVCEGGKAGAEGACRGALIACIEGGSIVGAVVGFTFALSCHRLKKWWKTRKNASPDNHDGTDSE